MATETEQQKTTLYIDADVHRMVKVAAAQDGVTLTWMVEQAMREFLERRKNGQTRSK